MSAFYKGKVVIVTGASSGIGEACARILWKEGAKLVLAARRMDKLQALARELPGSFPVDLDVTKPVTIERMVKDAQMKFGRIDVLINNAGALLYKTMQNSSPEEIRNVMEVNYFGAVACARAVIPIMKKQGGGSIANIASIAGRVGFPNLGYYGASKFALVGFSETLRQELAPDKIYVTTICPGTIYTPMVKDIIDDALRQGKRLLLIPPERCARAILRGVEKRKFEVFVPFATRILYLLHFLFPRFAEWLAWHFRASEKK